MTHPRMIEVSLIQLESLRYIHKSGPIQDGDLPSKSARDALIVKGLVISIIVKGDDGYQACTLEGANLLRVIRDELSRV